MYDITAKKLTRLDNEKLMHPTISPDGSKIAFVKNNNLVLYDIATRSAVPLQRMANGTISSMETATGYMKKSLLLPRLTNGAQKEIISLITALMKAM